MTSLFYSTYHVSIYSVSHIFKISEELVDLILPFVGSAEFHEPDFFLLFFYNFEFRACLLCFSALWKAYETCLGICSSESLTSLRNIICPELIFTLIFVTWVFLNYRNQNLRCSLIIIHVQGRLYMFFHFQSRLEHLFVLEGMLSHAPFHWGFSLWESRVSISIHTLCGTEELSPVWCWN